MYGKYHDSRVYQHLVHTYSRVPYLDHEIYNVENVALRESRRANQRALIAQQGLQRTKQHSEILTNSIRDSRNRKDQDAQEFIITLQKAQEACLEKEKQTWSNFEKQQQENRLSHLRDQKYLQSLLKSNSTKAESRLGSVRRWN